MKYLSDYIQDAQSALFKKHGGFFAFNKEQLEEGKEKGMKYCSCGGGLFAPVNNAENLITYLRAVAKDGIRQDIAENGIEAIIRRELGNYETQIQGNWQKVYRILKDDYPVSREQVKKAYGVFYQKCIDNDWF